MIRKSQRLVSSFEHSRTRETGLTMKAWLDLTGGVWPKIIPVDGKKREHSTLFKENWYPFALNWWYYIILRRSILVIACQVYHHSSPIWNSLKCRKFSYSTTFFLVTVWPITTWKAISSQWTPVQGFRFPDGELRRAVTSLRKTTKFVNQNWDSIQTQIGQTRGKDPVKTKNN